MNFHNRRKSINKISVITTTFLFFFIINILFFNLIFNSAVISKYFSKIEKQKDYKGELYLLGVCPAIQTTTESNSKSVVITYNNKFVSIPKTRPELVKSSLILKNNENRSPHEFNTSKLIESSPLIAILGSSIGYINVFQFRDLFISTQKLMQNNDLWVMILSFITLLALGFKCIIVNPIKKLEAQINNMENENIFVHTHVKGLNEIIHLSESFNHMIDIIYSQKKKMRN